MDVISDIMGPLKPVFDACDQNGDGFVKTKDLVLLLKNHTGSEEDMTSMTRFLDPYDKGSISFSHFCKGVKEFMAAQGVQEDVPTDNNNLTIGNLDEKEEFLLNDQNGYLTDDSMADENTNPFQRNLLYSTYPPIGNLKKRDPPLSPQIVESDYNSDHSEYSDVSTGQVTSTPKMKRKFGSMRNRLVSPSLTNGTRPYRSYEDLENAVSDNDQNLTKLSEKLSCLTIEMSNLQEENLINLNKHNKMKEENKKLTERVNALDELLEQQKITTDEKVSEESRKYSNALARLERESEEKLERLQHKLNEAEEEITQLKQVDPMIKRELEACLEEKRKLEEKIETLEFKLQEKERTIEELDEKNRSEKSKFQQERKQHTQVVVELQSRIDELKSFKKDAESRLPDFVNVAAEKGDLEDQLRALQKENANLLQSREELKVQLIQQGKCLLEKNTSLADELFSADKEDVLKALRDQETLNHRLRAYTDSILMMIMEYHPELLEK